MEIENDRVKKNKKVIGAKLDVHLKHEPNLDRGRPLDESNIALEAIIRPPPDIPCTIHKAQGHFSQWRKDPLIKDIKILAFKLCLRL